MEEEIQSSVEQPPVSSFASRATDVFASPGKMYSEVSAAAVQNSSWAIPYILSLLITIGFTFALFTNQSLKQQILETSKQEMQKRVDEGKMTQAQMDQGLEFMEASGMFLIVGIISAAFFVTLAMFGVPLILWLAAKLILKSGAGYKKMLEVYGLASLIGVLGSIVTLLMMFLFDSVRAAPGGSLLFMSGYDPHNFLQNFVSAIGVFTVWETVVTGIGISKVSAKTAGTGIGIAAGLWLLWVILSSVFGWGMR